MTKKEMQRLVPGDIIRHKNKSEWAFVVHQNFGDRITCVRTIEVRDPVSWEKVEKESLSEGD